MLSRYSHVWMETERRLDEIGTRQSAADKRRKEKAAQQEQIVAISTVVQ